jgi:hypothetical protein
MRSPEDESRVLSESDVFGLCSATVQTFLTNITDASKFVIYLKRLKTNKANNK